MFNKFAPQPRLLRPLHEQHCWQIFEENLAYKLRHPVSPRSSEIPIDDNHGHKDTDGVHDEGKEQILGYQWQHQGSWRKDLAD